MAVSAVEAAAQASRINQSAMLGLSQAIESTFEKASQAQRLEASVYQNIAQSAMNFKQQEIDTFFKQKQLELNAKQLELANLEKGTELQLKGQYYSMMGERLRVDLQKAQNAERNKPINSVLQEISRQVDNEAKQIQFQIETKRKIIEKPTPEQILRQEDIKASRDIDALNAKLNELSQKRTNVQYEMTNIASGEEYSGKFFKIPGFDPSVKPANKNTTTTSVNIPNFNITPSPLLPQGEGRINTDNPFLPSIDGKFPQPDPKAMEEAMGMRRAIGIEDEEGNEYLEGQIPNENFPSDPPVEKYTKEQILRLALDTRFTGDEISQNPRFREALSNADEATKKTFSERKTMLAKNYLGFLGSGKGYDPLAKIQDPDKFQDYALDQYKRFGGSMEEIQGLVIEAENTLSAIREEVYTKLLAESNASEGNVRIQTAIEYNKWLKTRLTPTEKPQAEGERGVAADGSIRREVPINLDVVKSKRIGPESNIIIEPGFNPIGDTSSKQIAETAIKVVRENFIERATEGGRNRYFLTTDFADYVSKNQKLANILLPRDTYVKSVSGGTGGATPVFDSEKYYKDLTEKVKSLKYGEVAAAMEEYFRQNPSAIEQFQSK